MTASRDVRKYSAAGTFLYDFDVPLGVTWLAVRNDGVLVVPEAFGGTVRLVTVNDATRTATAGPSFGPGGFDRVTSADVAADGTMYVANPTSGVVRVYAPDGRELRTIGSRAVFPGDMRGVVLDEARGRLYVADAQTGEIDVLGLDGTHIGQIAALGTGAGQFPDGARQLELLPDGSVLAADYGGRRVQRFSPDGRLLAVFPHPGQDAGRDGFVEPRGLALDPATGDVLVADPWAQRVQRFAPDGTLLAAHGVRGSFPPDGMNYPRSVAVDPASGDVWVPNYEGAPNLVVYDRGFHHLRTIATPRFVNDIEIVGGLAYLLVRRPGEVRVHDVATSALVRTFPLPAEGRGVAVDPATGELWVTSDFTPDLWVFGPTGDRRRTLRVDSRGWGVVMVGDVVFVADAAASRIMAFDRASGARLGVVGSAGNALGQLNGPSGLTRRPGRAALRRGAAQRPAADLRSRPGTAGRRHPAHGHLDRSGQHHDLLGLAGGGRWPVGRPDRRGPGAGGGEGPGHRPAVGRHQHPLGRVGVEPGGRERPGRRTAPGRSPWCRQCRAAATSSP